MSNIGLGALHRWVDYTTHYQKHALNMVLQKNIVIANSDCWSKLLTMF